MAKKIFFEQLIEWVEGDLDEAQASEVAAQVAQADEETQATVAWLRTFKQASDKVVMAPLPQRVRVQLTRNFAAFSRDRKKPGFLQRLKASLTFDSGLNLAPVGVRKANLQTQSRQFVYTADTIDITLYISKLAEAAALTVAGQIFANDDQLPEPFIVQLIQDDVEINMTMTNDLGEFRLTAVPSGTYTLILSSDSAEIAIADVAIQE